MRIRKIKFRGLDDWYRPIYKVLVELPYYIGSTNKLFDYADPVSKIDDYFEKHPEELVYFGEHFNCEPMGQPLADDIKLEIERSYK